MASYLKTLILPAPAMAGIAFVGPPARPLERLSDESKRANSQRQRAFESSLAASTKIKDVKEARALAAKLGYPVMLKAAKGGGGRGMRVVHSDKELPDTLAQAQREALTRIGSSDVFLEKFVARARHLEVQLLGDAHGNLVHLSNAIARYSAGTKKLSKYPHKPFKEVRDKLCNAALAIGNRVGYVSAGTVDFTLAT